MFFPFKENWKRAEHFYYYYDRLKVYLHVTDQVDLGELIAIKKEKNLRFYPLLLYATLQAIKEQKEFCMGMKDGQVGYYDRMHPVYPIFHEDDHSFTDTWATFGDSFKEFYQDFLKGEALAKANRGMKARPEQPENFAPISVVPWRRFTAISSTSPSSYLHLFPVITYGKYYQEDGTYKIPCAVNIFHGCADGYHIMRFFDLVEEYCRNTDWVNH